MTLFGSKKSIYLDNAASTRIDVDVAKVMKEYLGEKYANPSAIHTLGVQVRKEIDKARAKIAKLIYAHSDEIIFTGSATESINLAILGVMGNMEGKIPHIITTNIEHPAVLETCKCLEKRNLAEVTYLPVEANGILNPKLLREAIKENTVLVSVHYANSEIGTIQPITEIAKEIRHYRKNNNTTFPLFHTDAVQAINYLDISNVERLGVDLLSFNGSKIYGPKGTGVLFKKRGIRLGSISFGGGQEFGMRSGTENVMGIVGIAKAIEVASKMKESEVERLKELQKFVFEGIEEVSKKTGYKIIVNGDTENRIPNNVNVSIERISSELLVIELDAKRIYVSEKSACKSEDESNSHVITALRNTNNDSFTKESLRISMGKDTKRADLEDFLKSLENILSKYSRWK